MNLVMASGLAEAYKSGSQRARKVTEPWGAANLYCPNCPSPRLNQLPDNTKAIDYECPNCHFWYQLKGQKKRIGNSIADGDYKAMMDAMDGDRIPNFIFMHYQLPSWTVISLLLVPSFAFPKSAIIKRNPLSPSARRAGWVGCNFDLKQIPSDGRILLVDNGRITSPEVVRGIYHRLKPLKDIPLAIRGWMLDVLTAIRSLNKAEFTTAEMYRFVSHFKKLHPNNNNVQEKIRQQLQCLRDAGLLKHESPGKWRLI